eukprot:COSAG01_NODE_75431_length_196_cov_35.876289_1_plen_36_part_10
MDTAVKAEFDRQAVPGPNFFDIDQFQCAECAHTRDQ